MKNIFKTIAKIYGVMVAIEAIGLVISYFAGCKKYGRNIMRFGVKCSLMGYQFAFQRMLLRIKSGIRKAFGKRTAPLTKREQRLLDNYLSAVFDEAEEVDWSDIGCCSGDWSSLDW